MKLTKEQLNSLIYLSWSDIRASDTDGGLLDTVLKQIKLTREELVSFEIATADFKDCPLEVYFDEIDSDTLKITYSIDSHWVDVDQLCLRTFDLDVQQVLAEI